MWGEKRYHSLDYALKSQFGEKVYRIALNGGMTCPNRDGKIGYGGCIFCSAGGSGDFAADPSQSVSLPVLPAKQLQNSLQKGKPFLPESVRCMLISHISRPLRVPMPP